MPTPTLVGATGAATFRIDESSRQGGVSITSYDFEIDVAGGDFSNPTARGSLSASDGAVGIIVTPLQAGTYIARARAVDATGTGAWSESSAPTVVSPAAPAAPTPFALISGAEPALFVTQSGAVPLADVVSVGTPAYVDGVLALDGNDLRVPYAALPPPTNGWTLIAEITPSVISGSCTIISAQTAWNEHGTVYLNGGPGQVWRTIYSAKGVTIAGGAVLSTASFVGRRAVFALASSPGDHRAVVEGEVVNALTAPAGPALPFSVLSFGRNMWSSSTAFRAVMHWAYFAPYAMTTDEIRAISAQMSSATIVGDEPAKLVTASGPAPLADAISAGALTYEGGALRTDGNGFAIDLADLPSWVDGWTLIADVTIREVTGGAGTIISLERKYNDHVSLVLNGGNGRLRQAFYSAEGVLDFNADVYQTDTFVDKRTNFAMTCAPGDQRVLVDGAEVATRTDAAGPSTTVTKLYVGHNSWKTAGIGPRMVIHKIRFIPRVMTSDEIREQTALMRGPVVDDRNRVVLDANGEEIYGAS